MPCPCSPQPYVIPNGFSTGNQKHWAVEEVYKNAKPLVWDAAALGFFPLEARDENNPDYYINSEGLTVIDGCGDPVCFQVIQPVGPVCRTADVTPFIVARGLCIGVDESDDFTLTTNNMFPDSLCVSECDCPPILSSENT